MEEEQLIFGIRPIMEALSSGVEIEKVLISDTGRGPQFQELVGILRKAGINHQYVPVQKLNRLHRGNHQGVIAYLSLIPKIELYDFLNVELAKGTVLRILVLDHLTDVRNLGALARSAVAFGFHGIIAPEKGSVLIHSGAIKSSAGALLKIPLIRVPNLSAAMKDLRLHGIYLAAISEHGKTELSNLPHGEAIALVLGNEETGIRAENLKLCAETYRIPMEDSIGSLNVSVAGAIAMYEVSKA
ncbi:MAG: 23S rRNA (guanosine(2251)-2'-O)-methyltransferase RlmB [Flavobacteriales bacterium]|nr:23S rRNA (guanosine(2251)-2'-O)-methyltransferase RlmB [Flavobacteriales bacterium]